MSGLSQSPSRISSPVKSYPASLSRSKAHHAERPQQSGQQITTSQASWASKCQLSYAHGQTPTAIPKPIV
ncbi:hypothetical protein BDV11DRAFT_196690 [Aspergillus similis]